jgi:transposase
VAHSILVIIWHLLTKECDYRDLGGDYFVKRDAVRHRDSLVNQLLSLGYKVTLEEAYVA